MRVEKRGLGRVRGDVNHTHLWADTCGAVCGGGTGDGS